MRGRLTAGPDGFADRVSKNCGALLMREHVHATRIGGAMHADLSSARIHAYEHVRGTLHFGDGKDVFDSQLTPGKHKLALQLGDDLHDTMPGACSVITVNVK